MDITAQSLGKNGGQAVIDLFRIMPNQISFFEFDEESNKFIAKDIDVNNHVRGEILILASFSPLPHPQWIPI